MKGDYYNFTLMFTNVRQRVTKMNHTCRSKVKVIEIFLFLISLEAFQFTFKS